MRTVTVSHNWYSFLRCSGIAVPTVFGVPSDISCQDQGRVHRAWSGLVGMKAEPGHSLTPSSCCWERTAPVVKLEASHSKWNGPVSDGNARTGAEVTAVFSVSKAFCSGGPQDHFLDFCVRAWSRRCKRE